MSNPNDQENYLGTYDACVQGFEGSAYVVEIPANGAFGTGIGILAIDGSFRQYYPAREISFSSDRVVHNIIGVANGTLTSADPTPAELADGIEQLIDQWGGSSA